ncbi:hypothetical protein GUJ93_ZPchr0006g42108 [Zizania palustris]|uniref:Uncharacterized protein n=1 Tax=Zizania palustris TaxID=103762 RepID=A0A8J5TDH7_ZIZPA|nr:hypothetical protein GUJ93_ZPchr0006g42108 [Zizania palustris]
MPHPIRLLLSLMPNPNRPSPPPQVAADVLTAFRPAPFHLSSLPCTATAIVFLLGASSGVDRGATTPMAA